MELNIKKVGMTVKTDGEVFLALDGDMPADSVVVFMDRPSWDRLKKELPQSVPSDCNSSEEL